MSSRSVFAYVPLAGLLAIGLLGAAPAASADSGGQSLKPAKSARNNVIETKRRFRSVRARLPIGPAYVYYDYPYYYSRGYYPTHIGGYTYYPSYSYRSYCWGNKRESAGPCDKRARRN
jgi:hypothetical protein